MKKAVSLVKSILSALVTVILSLFLITVMYQKISGEIPGIFGYHLMNVLTGSMEPEIMTGDAVLLRECRAEEVKQGDVICYRCTVGAMDGQMITHKVITAPYECDGVIWLQTQGVANLIPDEPITGEQVYGKVVLRLAVVGKIYGFFCTVPGLILVILPILWMIFDGFRSIAAAWTEEEETAESGETGDDSKKA